MKGRVKTVKGFLVTEGIGRMCALGEQQFHRWVDENVCVCSSDENVYWSFWLFGRESLPFLQVAQSKSQFKDPRAREDNTFVVQSQ